MTVAPGCGGRRADSLRTPATIWVSRRATRCSLTLSLPGYADQTVSLTRVTSDSVDDNFVAVNAAESLEGGVVLGLFTAVGVGIDALTGAMWQQVPSRLSLTLVERDAPGEESKRPEERFEDWPEVTPEGSHRMNEWIERRAEGHTFTWQLQAITVTESIH